MTSYILKKYSVFYVHSDNPEESTDSVLSVDSELNDEELVTKSIDRQNRRTIRKMSTVIGVELGDLKYPSNYIIFCLCKMIRKQSNTTNFVFKKSSQSLTPQWCITSIRIKVPYCLTVMISIEVMHFPKNLKVI